MNSFSSTPDTQYQQQQNLQSNYTLVQLFSNQIQQVLEFVSCKQIDALRQKYHYFLKKLEKQKVQRLKLVKIYQNIQNIVNQSNPVKDVAQGIQFINKIIKEVKIKTQKITQKIHTQKEIQKICQIKINKLKQQLINQKSIYFNLKRDQDFQQKFIILQKKQYEKDIFDRSFKQSAKQNRERRQMISAHSNFQFGQNSNKKITSQIYKNIEFIENMKSNLINVAKKTYQYKQNKKTRQTITKFNRTIQLQKIQKKCHKKQQFNLKNKKNKNYFLDDNLFANQQCNNTFRQLELQKQKFRKLKSQQILQIVTKQGKIQNLLSIIQNQKKHFLKANTLINKKIINL